MPPPPSKTITRTSSTSRQWRLLLGLLVAWGLLFALYTHERALLDWWQLRDYTAPSDVVTLADQTTMTATARHDFYVNHPAILAKAPFVQACPNNGGEKTIILGCYRSGQRGIYVLDVNDPRLNGVEQVTAAHEMLHSAYERLSRSERKRVDAMLADYFQHGLTDQRVRDTIESYKQTEPNDLLNEMHSIFGTEVAQLPAPLETYYKRYFGNRQTITTFAANYDAEFTSRQQQVKTDDAQLKQLEGQLSTLVSQLDAQQRTIDGQRTQLEAARDSGDTATYNNGVAAYNAQIDSYNAGVAQYRALYDQYKALLAARNALAQEINLLTTELNAKDLTPINQ